MQDCPGDGAPIGQNEMRPGHGRRASQGRHHTQPGNKAGKEKPSGSRSARNNPRRLSAKQASEQKASALFEACCANSLPAKTPSYHPEWLHTVTRITPRTDIEASGRLASIPRQNHVSPGTGRPHSRRTRSGTIQVAVDTGPLGQVWINRPRLLLGQDQ